jgi:hypothetical protein
VRGEDVRALLPGARAAAADPATPEAARLLVAVEVALAGEKKQETGNGQPATGNRQVPEGDGLLYELAAATVARLEGRAGDEAAALARARALPGGAAALARRGDVDAALAAPELSRFHDIVLADEPLTLGRPTPRALPPARPGCAADAAALFTMRRAARADRSLGERLAREYVDREPALACRAPHAALELARAGNLEGALAFAAALAADLPDEPEGHFLAARVLVALGRAPGAALEATQAEALARHRGARSAAFAEALRRAGQPIEAIGAARTALGLADPPARWDAYEALIAAALAAGRDDDAGRAFEAYRRELPPPLLADAADRLRATLGLKLAPPWLPPPRPPAPRIAAARVAELEREGDTRGLLLVGLYDDGERGVRALEAYARLQEKRGRRDLARAARAEARMISVPF